MEQIDRYKGCLVGLAVGDALGAPFESKLRGTYSKLVDMEGGGTYNLPVGVWTDDTSMALCLATSLIEKGEFDLEDQMKLYLNWYLDGFMSSTGRCFGIGRVTRKALDRYQLTLDPCSGLEDPNTAGNGSIMRLAPIPMFCGNDLIKAFYLSGESSKTTHGCAEAIQCCQLFGSLVSCALNGLGKDEMFSIPFSDFSEPNVLSISQCSYKEKTEEDIKTSAYVIDSLEAALWSFYKSDNFEDGMIRVVNLGGDTDTVGAIYGQLAGAYWGIESIPQRWLNKLYAKEDIMYIAEQLHKLRIII